MDIQCVRVHTKLFLESFSLSNVLTFCCFCEGFDCLGGVYRFEKRNGITMTTRLFSPRKQRTPCSHRDIMVSLCQFFLELIGTSIVTMSPQQRERDREVHRDIIFIIDMGLKRL